MQVVILFFIAPVVTDGAIGELGSEVIIPDDASAEDNSTVYYSDGTVGVFRGDTLLYTDVATNKIDYSGLDFLFGLTDESPCGQNADVVSDCLGQDLIGPAPLLAAA